ncbi:hypothetical protein U2F10_34310 [Leptothoe sp. EHU-05/26/07-4]
MTLVYTILNIIHFVMDVLVGVPGYQLMLLDGLPLRLFTLD